MTDALRLDIIVDGIKVDTLCQSRHNANSFVIVVGKFTSGTLVRPHELRLMYLSACRPLSCSGKAEGMTRLSGRKLSPKYGLPSTSRVVRAVS